MPRPAYSDVSVPLTAAGLAPFGQRASRITTTSPLLATALVGCTSVQRIRGSPNQQFAQGAQLALPGAAHRMSDPGLVRASSGVKPATSPEGLKTAARFPASSLPPSPPRSSICPDECLGGGGLHLLSIWGCMFVKAACLLPQRALERFAKPCTLKTVHPVGGGECKKPKSPRVCVRVRVCVFARKDLL